MNAYCDPSNGRCRGFQSVLHKIFENLPTVYKLTRIKRRISIVIIFNVRAPAGPIVPAVSIKKYYYSNFFPKDTILRLRRVAYTYIKKKKNFITANVMNHECKRH
jgi:hypothetical protein